MSISAVGAIGMPATRVGDDIAHTMARFGLFAGMIAGALLVAATVATGGAALVVVGAAVAAGAAGGGLVGMAVGGMYMGPPTGKLVLGSPNVFINHRPATMTFFAAAACGHHPGPPIPVATGSATVMINNGYAAREGETMGCSAVIIASCSPDVIIGGESVQDPRVEIKPEIPDWVVNTLTVVAIAGAVIATGGAVAAAMAGGASFAGAAGTVALGVGRGMLASAVTGAAGSRIGYAIDGERGAIAGGAIGSMVGLPGRRMAGAFNRRYKVTTQGMGSNFGNVRIQRRPSTTWQKPTNRGAWRSAPNPDKWRAGGGKVYERSFGRVTYESPTGTRVNYNRKGYPNFKPHAIDRTTLRNGFQTRPADFRLANQQTGRSQFGDRSPKDYAWGNHPPRDYTWHHHQNGKTMELVPEDIHSLFRHSGGIAGL